MLAMPCSFHRIFRLSHLLPLLATLPACGASAAASAPAAAPPPASAIEAEPGAPLNRIRHRGKDLYLSGFNIAWFDFAKDIGKGIDEERLRRAASDVSKAGGNTLRWWIHVDGTTTPEWSLVEGQRKVSGPGGSFIADMQRALDIVTEYGVFIVPSLWSFDMLRDNPERRPPVRDNYRLLTEDAVLESYIQGALVPMVRALNGHPSLVAWELFNEPENMTESWFRTDPAFYGGEVPTLERLQRVQGKLAAAIHRVAREQNQEALVTTGSKSMGKYTSDAAGGMNLYRDDRLIAAADGDELATLDFYEPHYYDNEGDKGAWSVFHHPADHWRVDKPIVVGEFHTLEPLNLLGEVIEPREMCQRLVDYGYAGGWPWQWNEHAEPIMACLKAMSSAPVSRRSGPRAPYISKVSLR
jgi:mannan endo-1,4-beta-mannosidase